MSFSDRRVFSKTAAAALTLAVCACGGGSRSTTSTAPTTPTPTTPTPPADTWSVTGRIVATGSAQGVGEATVTPGWSLAAVTADAEGKFEIGARANPPSNPYPATIAHDGYLSHDVWIGWQRGPRQNVTLDVIREAAPFSIEFYRQFVRDMYDKSDGSPWPLLRWDSSPSFYLRTVDQTGRAVESSVISTTIGAISRAVPAFTAGHYSAAAIETGTEARSAEPGWINVDFERAGKSGSHELCGRAYVGRNPGSITLWVDVCDCGSTKVPPAVTMHEVGHALGFFHVSDKKSIMYPFAKNGCRNENLSAAEAFHAAIAYSRPPLNEDPDKDPDSFRTLRASDFGPLVER